MLLEFRKQRDWEQFHDPKNLAEAISIEAAELLEHYLWKKPDDPSIFEQKTINKAKEELADLFIFITYLCDAYKILIAHETQLNAFSQEGRSLCDTPAMVCYSKP